MGFLKAFLHEFLVTLCARNCSRSTWCWLLIANLISTSYQKIYPISPEISFHTVCRGTVRQFKFVNELTRFTHSTPLKICFIVQTPQIGILKGEKRKNGGEVTEQQNIQNKKLPRTTKNVSFCSKKYTLMRGCTNERFC